MEKFNINQKFQFLHQLTTMVAMNATPSLIVTGEGGLGKTWAVNKALQDLGLNDSHYTSIKGYSTARGLYNTLYDNSDKLIIFDDCDSVLEDKVALNILKSALDSYDSRKITWMSKISASDEYPTQFDFWGRIIFISNKNSEKIDSAILSRSLVVDLSMTPDEKIERMQFIIGDILPDFPLEIKTEALQFLNEHKSDSLLNLRSLIKISKIRATFPENWRDLALFMLKK